MIEKLLNFETEPCSVPKEGDLYKRIEYQGKIFEIRYGFYEEQDRYSQYAEPMEIYPDFLNQPQYTREGAPFVTAFQNPCEYFGGNLNENSICEECASYRQVEELIGLCECPQNRKSMEER